MWVLAAIAWVVVVIAGSALTWVAIDRAGQQVTGDPASAETEPAVVGTVGSSPTPTRTHRPSGRPSSSTLTDPGATSAPTQHTTTPTTAPSSNGTGSAVTQTRTWSGEAGSVTVSCTGRTVRLKGAAAFDGWHVETGDSDSGDDIEVKFERNESEVKVRATCVGGVPHFQVEVGGDDG